MPTSISEAAAPRASVDAVLQFAWAAGVFTSGDAIALGWSDPLDDHRRGRQPGRPGLLRELQSARAAGGYRKGRPARRFELRADAAVVVGVDAGRGHVTATVADLRGATLVRETLEVREEAASDDDRRARVASAIDVALGAAGCTREEVLSIGVGVAAPVNATGDSPASSDGFWRRMNPQLGVMLSHWAPIVRVENDASLAAVAEGAVGAAIGCRNYIALLTGERFGAGVVITDACYAVDMAESASSRLLTTSSGSRAPGASATASPNGHAKTSPLGGSALTIPSPKSVATDSPVAPCSNSPTRAIQTHAESSGAPGPVLARVGGVLGSVFDPELIIISGAVAAGIKDVIAVAEPLLPDQFGLPKPRLVPSHLGAEVIAIGAIYAALEAAREGVLTLRPARLPLHFVDAPNSR